MREGEVNPEFKYVVTHNIFDIKMDDSFNRKSGLVEGRHKMAPSLSITQYSVVTRESVRLASLISGLNNIYICACIIGNEYLNAPCQEKNCGPKQDQNLGVKRDEFF